MVTMPELLKKHLQLTPYRREKEINGLKNTNLKDKHFGIKYGSAMNPNYFLRSVVEYGSKRKILRSGIEMNFLINSNNFMED